MSNETNMYERKVRFLYLKNYFIKNKSDIAKIISVITAFSSYFLLYCYAISTGSNFYFIGLDYIIPFIILIIIFLTIQAFVFCHPFLIKFFISDDFFKVFPMYFFKINSEIKNNNKRSFFKFFNNYMMFNSLFFIFLISGFLFDFKLIYNCNFLLCLKIILFLIFCCYLFFLIVKNYFLIESKLFFSLFILFNFFGYVFYYIFFCKFIIYGIVQNYNEILGFSSEFIENSLFIILLFYHFMISFAPISMVSLTSIVFYTTLFLIMNVFGLSVIAGFGLHSLGLGGGVPVSIFVKGDFKNQNIEKINAMTSNAMTSIDGCLVFGIGNNFVITPINVLDVLDNIDKNNFKCNFDKLRNQHKIDINIKFEHYEINQYRREIDKFCRSEIYKKYDERDFPQMMGHVEIYNRSDVVRIMPIRVPETKNTSQD